MHSVLVGEFASVESTLSPLSPSLSRAGCTLSIFTFYSRHIPASTYIYIYISSHRVTHDNIGQFAYETRRYSLFQTSLFYSSLSLSFSPRANQPLSGRAFLSSLALSILFNRVEMRKGSTVERDRLFA